MTRVRKLDPGEWDPELREMTRAARETTRGFGACRMECESKASRSCAIGSHACTEFVGEILGAMDGGIYRCGRVGFFAHSGRAVFGCVNKVGVSDQVDDTVGARARFGSADRYRALDH